MVIKQTDGTQQMKYKTENIKLFGDRNMIKNATKMRLKNLTNGNLRDKNVNGKHLKINCEKIFNIVSLREFSLLNYQLPDNLWHNYLWSLHHEHLPNNLRIFQP